MAAELYDRSPETGQEDEAIAEKGKNMGPSADGFMKCDDKTFGTNRRIDIARERRELLVRSFEREAQERENLRFATAFDGSASIKVLPDQANLLDTCLVACAEDALLQLAQEHPSLRPPLCCPLRPHLRCSGSDLALPRLLLSRTVAAAAAASGTVTLIEAHRQPHQHRCLLRRLL